MANRIRDVQQFGQSIWYDNLRRHLIASGALAEMVREGLRGVTSNPAIFEKALAGSSDYDVTLESLVRQNAGDAKAIYERLAIEDIQQAADVLHPVYRESRGADGYVSFEVSPHLAGDTAATIAEARRLHRAVGRANVMIKVPGTPAGMPAIATLIGEGISINVTLLFAIDAYEQAAEAYQEGLERLVARGGDPSRIAGVASFFLSRIDTLVDETVCAALDTTRDRPRRAALKSLLGKTAIANAKLAYARYQQIVGAPRWQTLAARGARPQRLLWASTGTKNPRYSKTMYVDELIGPDTVNTVPEETYVEFRDRGTVALTLTRGLDAARETMRTLEDAGISLREITDRLLEEAVEKFATPFDRLLSGVERKRQAILGGGLARQTYAVPGADEAVDAALAEWRDRGGVRRLWSRDASLWTGADEHQWLDWLHAVANLQDHLEPLQRIADDARRGGFRHALLLGMGGSSLAPWALRQTFGRRPGFPDLIVLDSIVPAQVRAAERAIDPAATLFIVASKSGATTEPDVLMRYFMARVREAGVEAPGSRFVAITDPGSALYRFAKQERFRHIAPGVPGIGGRYSVFSNFGMVPAAVMGLDVRELLDRAAAMVHSCAAVVPPDANPGVALGIVLGTLARRGRDKVTFLLSPTIAALGAWLEQLIAESTGKDGTGLVPVEGEEAGAPGVYGGDRLFVYVRDDGAATPDLDRSVDALERAGHPVVRIALDGPMDLGQEFFRWEIATAVAGAVLGIHPFNQPDVEASKAATRRLTEAFERHGTLAAERPLAEGDGLRLFADPDNAAALGAGAGRMDVEALLAAHLSRLAPGDYFAITAYLEMTGATQAALQALRHTVRDAKRVATTAGYGPRFLHSTGQLHKGGANTGVFLQITADDAGDLAIPGRAYSFGLLTQAQALGDLEVLAARRRRLLRVHLDADVSAGLARLTDLVRAACAAAPRP